MHELAIAGAIVQICADNAGDGTVTRVEVRIGYLRQVVPDALSFAFQLAAEGTPAEGAELVIEHVPARLACQACGAETELERLPLACAGCGSFAVDVVAGEECHVECLEIEHEPVVAGRR